MSFGSYDKWIYLNRMCDDNLTGIAIYSVPDLVLLKANQKYVEYWEPPYNIIKNCLGKRVDEIVDDWKGSKIEADWQDILKTGKTLQLKEFMYDRGIKGATYWDITVTPLYEDGSIKYLISNSIDVTDRVLDRIRIENQSRLISQQYEMLEAIIENISDDLIIIDREGNHMRTNKSARERYSSMTLENAEDVHNNFEFYNIDGSPIPVEDRPVSYILRGKKLIDKKLMMKSGASETYFSASGIPVFSNDGLLVGGVVCSRDITNEMKEKQQLEKNLIEQEEFFSNMSHELKTPLNVILSALQVLDLYSNDKYNESKASKYRRIMKQNCFRLLRLINNLIDMSKIDTGYINLELNNHNIVSIVEDITLSVADFIENKGLTLVFDTDSEEKFIACDPDKIERIILNLLSNAIKFTNEGGEIRVRIFDKRDYVNIIVEDTGIGIPEDKLGLIFERFKQVDKSLKRAHEGSGIGLSLVKSLVQLHNGTIEVSSKLGVGSCFSIMLPAATLNLCSVKPSEMLSSNNIERITLEFSDIYALGE